MGQELMSLSNKVDFQIPCNSRTWEMRGRNVEHPSNGNNLEMRRVMAFPANKKHRSSDSSASGRHAAVTFRILEHIGTDMLIPFCESRRKLDVADEFAPQL